MNPPASNRIPSLDGIRATAILCVITGHLWSRFSGPSGASLGASLLLAGFGVHVFFVLSGYLITHLLQEEHARAGTISLAAFYRRRCFRIFPAAFVYVLMVGWLSPASRAALPYAATYTVSWHLNDLPPLFTHLWSLSVEEQFYLLWPLALVLGVRRRAWVAWSAMLAAGIFRLALAFNLSPQALPYMHYSFPGAMDAIAAGCLLAIYEPQIRKRVGWMAEHGIIPIAVAAAAWTLDAALWGEGSTTASQGISVFWGLVPLLIALSIFLLIERRDWLFNNPVASAIGVLSYSLYLWQQKFTLLGPRSIVLSALLLAVCGMASYLLIERPMLKIGAALQARQVGRPPVPSEILCAK